MDDRKNILRQIGWSDELIEKCLSPNSKPKLELSPIEYNVLIASEQDVTNFVISLESTTTSDDNILHL